jgi:hypothetical protein
MKPAGFSVFPNSGRLYYDALSAELGRVTFKSNGDEAFNNEFLLNSNGDEALNNFFS